MMTGEYLSSLEKLFNTQLEISLMHTYGTMQSLHAYLVETYMPGGKIENAKVTMDDIMFSSDFGGEKKTKISIPSAPKTVGSCGSSRKSTSISRWNESPPPAPCRWRQICLAGL